MIIPSGRVSVASSSANGADEGRLVALLAPEDRELIRREQDEESEQRRFHAARGPCCERTADREQPARHQRDSRRPQHEPPPGDIGERQGRQGRCNRQRLYEPDAGQSNGHCCRGRDHPEEVRVAFDRRRAGIPDQAVALREVPREPESDVRVLGDTVEIKDVREEYERDGDHPPPRRIRL